MVRSKAKWAVPFYRRLREALTYNPFEGEFYWRISPHPKIKAGSRAGTRGFVDRTGYRNSGHVGFEGQAYTKARLAWFYMYAKWPTPFVDHVDGNAKNNTFGNLRQATALQNSYNKSGHRRSKTGLKGVCFTRGKYAAQIQVAGRAIYLGIYDTAERAHEVYCEAARKYHGEFARVR